MSGYDDAPDRAELRAIANHPLTIRLNRELIAAFERGCFGIGPPPGSRKDRTPRRHQAGKKETTR